MSLRASIRNFNEHLHPNLVVGYVSHGVTGFFLDCLYLTSYLNCCSISDRGDLFVKAGSIIPLAPYHEYSGVPLDTLLIVAYTPDGSQKSTFNLYEDDGESFLFEKEQYRWIALSYEYTDHVSQQIVIHKPMGGFQGSVQNRAYKIDIVNTGEPKAVHVNDKVFTNWHWDPATKKMTLELEKQNVNTDIVVEVKI